MSQASSAWKIPVLQENKKSSHPPSGIGARFAPTEALASQRSYFVEIPSNSVAALNHKYK